MPEEEKEVSSREKSKQDSLLREEKKQKEANEPRKAKEKEVFEVKRTVVPSIEISLYNQESKEVERTEVDLRNVQSNESVQQDCVMEEKNEME